MLLTGTFDPSQQRLIAGHTLGGATVLWVVTPLRLSDGSAIEVVRGWVSRVDDALIAPPSEAVQVTGRIRPLDAPPTVNTPLPPGESAGIDQALTQQLPYPARTGYVVRTAQVPPDPLSLEPVPSQPPPAPPGAKQFYLQNGLYTIQWGLFALLILYCWYRLFRSELATRTTATSTLRDNNSRSGLLEQSRHEGLNLGPSDRADHPSCDASMPVE